MQIKLNNVETTVVKANSIAEDENQSIEQLMNQLGMTEPQKKKMLDEEASKVLKVLTRKESRDQPKRIKATKEAEQKK